MNKLVWFVVLAISALAYGDRVHIDDKAVFKELGEIKAAEKKDKARAVGLNKAAAVLKRFAEHDKNIPGPDTYKEAFLNLDTNALTVMWAAQTKQILTELEKYGKDRDSLKQELKKDRNLDWEPFDVHADGALNADRLYHSEWRHEIVYLMKGTKDRITGADLTEREIAANRMLGKMHMIRLLQKINQDRILLSYGKEMLKEYVDKKPNELYRGKNDATKRLIAIGLAREEEKTTGNVRRNFVVLVGGKSIYEASRETHLPIDAYQTFLEKDGEADADTLRLGHHIMFERHVPEALKNYQDWVETKAERLKLKEKAEAEKKE